jgi:hypothetical protein
MSVKRIEVAAAPGVPRPKAPVAITAPIPVAEIVPAPIGLAEKRVQDARPVAVIIRLK